MRTTNFPPPSTEVVLKIDIEHLLVRLKAEVLSNPHDTRTVPSKTELATILGIGRATLYNILNGTTRHVDLDILGELLNELRRRGFAVERKDLFREEPKTEGSDGI